MAKADTKKVAVVLFNLGGPDSKNAIRPFLMNFFMDKNIIRLPVPFRCLLAAMIANKRSKREAGESYGELGDKSPLLENSEKQSKALERVLNDSRGTKDSSAAAKAKADKRETKFKTFVAMRYWHPMAPQIVRDVRDWGADEILIVPLYPQFSTTTTWSSLEQWNKAMFEAGMDVPTSMICCYHENAGFVAAAADNIRAEYEKALKDGHEGPRVLFSAHGLPESVIKDGDPYQWQCEKTAEAIVKQLQTVISSDSEKSQEGQGDSSVASLPRNDSFVDWQICYQSRVGPKKWIGPSLDEALEKAAADKKAVVVFAHAFTQEHVETLVELDIEYREEAQKLKLPGYYRAKTVGTHAAFIEGLAGLVKAHLGRKKIEAEGFKTPCPEVFGQCCMRMADAADYPRIKKVA